MKRPAFQFYPGDWLRDTSLRSCSVGARGLWIDMLCLMHEGRPYGHLKVGGKGIHAPILARMVGASLEEVKGWLGELEEADVYSILDGCIFSRRMVRDEEIRSKRAAGGAFSLMNPHVQHPKQRISLAPSLNPSSPLSLDPSPASAFAFASASAVAVAVPKPNKVKSVPRDKPAVPEGLSASGTETWEAYSASYFARYGANPVRNAKTNGQIAQLVRRIGGGDAPHVAAQYLRSNNRFYVQHGHSVGLLLADCEKLRTEWATGIEMTESQARQIDKTAGTGNVARKLIDEVKRGKE